MPARTTTHPHPLLAAPLVIAVALAVLTCGCHSLPKPTTPAQTRESQTANTPDTALDRLKAGNRRFHARQPVTRDLDAQRSATAGGQFPFAVVLGCIDSRCAPEQVFDQGIGDIFTARVAGNVVNDDILGSMEFACRVAGAKLIVVLGHSQCGAIKGAANEVQLGHLTALLQRIQPSVAASTPSGQPTPPTPKLIEAITEDNVRRMTAQIPNQSPVLAELQRTGKLKIVGGIYSLETGVVQFLE